MGEHARPRIPARHRKPGMPARAAAATAAAATGTAAAGVIILAGHASAAPVSSAAFSHVAANQVSITRTEENVGHQPGTRQGHLWHLRHLNHLRHLALARENARHVQVAAVITPHVSSASGVFSFAALKSLWMSAGGPSWAAITAACIAMHESGGRSWVISPTNDFGLWQINGSHGAMASLNPGVNARSAVIISGGGTNWGAWTTHSMCGV